MAQDKFIDAKISEFEGTIIQTAQMEDKTEYYRLLKLFTKEIERKTRHKAVDLVQQAANAIEKL